MAPFQPPKSPEGGLLVSLSLKIIFLNIRELILKSPFGGFRGLYRFTRAFPPQILQTISSSAGCA